jgi:hypothetical protein
MGESYLAAHFEVYWMHILRCSVHRIRRRILLSRILQKSERFSAVDFQILGSRMQIFCCSGRRKRRRSSAGAGHAQIGQSSLGSKHPFPSCAFFVLDRHFPRCTGVSLSRGYASLLGHSQRQANHTRPHCSASARL